MYVQGIDCLETVSGEDEMEMYNAEYESFSPREVCISMKQGDSAAAVPVVEVGDHVRCGQLIGAGTTGAACPVYASISGIVIKIWKKRYSVHEMVSHIVIQSDGRQPLWMTGLPGKEKDAFSRLKNMGIISMIGKHHPLLLSIMCQGKLKELCLAAFDREPMVYSDYRLLVECPAKVLLGAKILAEIFHFESLVIYVCHDEINYILEKTVQTYSQALRPLENIRFCKISSNMYKKSCSTLEKVEYGMWCSAMELGAVYDSYYDGRPMTARGITVSGLLNSRKNLWVPNGAYIKDLINYCGGIHSSTGTLTNEILEKEGLCVVEGGPLRGHCVDINSGCVSLLTESILVLKIRHEEEEECLLCRNCCNVCPMDLKPLYIEKSMKNAPELCHLLDVDRCVECGWCSYVCPSHHSLKEIAAVAKKRPMISSGEKKFDMEAGLENWDYIDLELPEALELEPLVPASQSGPYIHNEQSSLSISQKLFMGLIFMAVIYSISYGPAVLIRAGTAAAVFFVYDWVNARFSFVWKTALINGLAAGMAMVFVPSWNWFIVCIAVTCITKHYFRVNPVLAGITTALCLSRFVVPGQEERSLWIVIAWMIVWLYLIYEMIILPWASMFFLLIFQWFSVILGGALLWSPAVFMAAVWFMNDYKNGGKDTPIQRTLAVFAGAISSVFAVLLPGGAGIFLGVFVINIIACNLMTYTI